MPPKCGTSHLRGSKPPSGPPSRGSGDSRGSTPYATHPQTPVASSDEEDSSVPVAPVQFSPVKQRQRREANIEIANKTDHEVWDLPDNEIIGM